MMRLCTFRLGDTRLAVEVAHSRGVVLFEDVTMVPGAPAHVLGHEERRPATESRPAPRRHRAG